MNRHNRTSPFRSSGFTIIEAVVAFLVLAAGLLALFSFYGTVQKTSGEARVQAQAVAFAEDKLQELESFLATSDGRLAAGGTDVPAAGFARTWAIADPAGCTPDSEGLIACQRTLSVTVAWTDRDGNAKNATVTSDVDFGSPTQGMEQFAKMLLALQQPSAGDDEVITPPKDVGGREEVGEPIPIAEFLGDIPLDYEGDNVYVYRIYISGLINAEGSSSSDGIIIEAPTVEVVTSEAVIQYQPVCTWTETDYECQVYYLSTTDGWQGSITYQASASGRNQPRFCRPTTVHPPYPPDTALSDQFDFLIASTSPAPNTQSAMYEVNFNPLAVSALVNVEVRSNACPQ